MRRFGWVALLIAALALLLVAMAWWSLPRLLEAMPGQVSGRLPEPILDAITTPLPTALPAPQGVQDSNQATIVIPTLEASTAEESDGSGQAPSDTATPNRLSSSNDKPVADPSPIPSPTPSATATPIPLPAAVQIAGLEVIPQKFNNCGPANLTMALNFFGEATDQLVVGEAVKPSYDDRNVSPEELVSYVNNKTALKAAMYSGGDQTLLQRLLAAGYPVIVEKGLFLSESQGWMGHYLTLTGYDEPAQLFQSLDTYLGPWDGSGRMIDFETLDEQWSHFNHTFIIVYPPIEEKAIHDILGEEMLDPALMWQRASLAAESAANSDPENAFLWFNLGTSLTNLGEVTGEVAYFENAAVAFDRALKIGLPWRMAWYQFKPYVAYLAVGRIDYVLELTEAMLTSKGGKNVEETYLYQGHALAAKGELIGAKRAYQEAIRLKPGYEQAVNALQDLERIAQESPSGG